MGYSSTAFLGTWKTEYKIIVYWTELRWVLLYPTSIGTVGAAAPTWMASYGASSGYPFLPSPTVERECGQWGFYKRKKNDFSHSQSIFYEIHRWLKVVSSLNYRNSKCNTKTQEQQSEMTVKEQDICNLINRQGQAS